MRKNGVLLLALSFFIHFFIIKHKITFIIIVIFSIAMFTFITVTNYFKSSLISLLPSSFFAAYLHTVSAFYLLFADK